MQSYRNIKFDPVLKKARELNQVFFFRCSESFLFFRF